jgi:RNA polymerase sigma factor (sigma-70 family)
VRREVGGWTPEPAVTDTHHELTASIARLGFRKRAVLVLRFYDGLPDDEIAAALGMRAATVRSTVARALRELREVLGDDD